MNWALIDRQSAFNAGLKHFFTGKPCSYGHTDRRYVSTGSCLSCHKMHSREYRKEIKLSAIGRQQGLFQYRLHPDDHAAALAYCQALDMQRGKMPAVGKQPVATPPRSPQEIAAIRNRVFGLNPQPADSDYVPPL